MSLHYLTSSNINRFSKKNYLLILLPVPSDVITDVIGMWSVFLESFVYLKRILSLRMGRLNSDVVLFSIVRCFVMLLFYEN